MYIAIRVLLIAAMFAASGGAASADPLDDAYVARETKDYATALKLFRTLADQGDDAAQVVLGNMYRLGQGVTKNDAEAVNWFRKAADQGNADAQTYLGNMYARGDGVPENYVQAYSWFNIAAARGNENAKKNKGIIGKKMTREQIAEAQKLSAEWKPVAATK